MGLTKSSMTFFFTIMALCCVVTMATQYKVGDSAGWTRHVPVDYYQWASGKKFFVGDTLLFEYLTAYHNVTEVTMKNFMQCNNANPIAVYNTGSDKIVLKRPGHYFFICGALAHCQAGLKLSVRVDCGPGQCLGPPEQDSPSSDAKAPAPSTVLPPSYNGGAQAPWAVKPAPIPAPGPANLKKKH